MIEQLKENIIKANASYRKGNPIMSDSEYDTLLEELALLSPDDDLLSLVGHVVVDESLQMRLSVNYLSGLDSVHSLLVVGTRELRKNFRFDGVMR